MFNKKLENIKTKHKHRSIRAKRQSGNKIWVSKPEIKHTNDKIAITLYIYNKEYNTYLKKLSKLPITWGIKSVKYYYNTVISLSKQINILNELLKNKINTNLNYKIIRYKIKKLFRYINIKNKKNKSNLKNNPNFKRAIRLKERLLKRKSFFLDKLKELYRISINKGSGYYSFKKEKKTDKFRNYIHFKYFIIEMENFYNKNKQKIFFLNKEIFNKVKGFDPKYINICINILNKSLLYKQILESKYIQEKVNISKINLIKEINYIKYKQLLLFNKLKFKDTFLTPLKEIIEKIYKKDIEFNIISLKNFHLSGNILSQIVLNKIKNRKNIPLAVLYKTLRKIKTPILNKKTIKRVDTRFVGVQNLILNNHIKTVYIEDFLNNFIKTNNNNLKSDINIDDMVIKNTEKKIISGVFLKVSGRITRRIIAERSTYKFRHVGTLKNVNSSFKGLSSVVLRGNDKANVENTILKSKNIIGSFGLKGWVASY